MAYIFFFFKLGFCKIQLKKKNLGFLFRKKIKIFFSQFLKFTFKIFSNINQFLYNYKYNFKSQLIIKGIGYKVKIIKKKIYLIFGFNHLLVFKIPLFIKFFFKNKILTVIGYNTSLLFLFISKFLKLKKFNIYKNTGFCFKNEIKLLKKTNKS